MATRRQLTEEEIIKLQNELLSIMLKRAKITEKDIYESALKDWVNDNLDLLTKEEISKYKGKVLV